VSDVALQDNSVAPLRARVLDRLKLRDLIFHIVTYAAAVIVLAILAGVILALVIGSMPALRAFGNLHEWIDFTGRQRPPECTGSHIGQDLARASRLVASVQMAAGETLPQTFLRGAFHLVIRANDVELGNGQAVPRGVLGLFLGSFGCDSPLLDLARAIVNRTGCYRGSGGEIPLGRLGQFGRVRPPILRRQAIELPGKRNHEFMRTG
jgi:hypothetical protein